MELLADELLNEKTPDPAVEYPTIWGLDPVRLHDRFWAARGVQVVRAGQPSERFDDAELFLLTDPRTLVIFQLRPVVSEFEWLTPDLFIARLKNTRETTYREAVQCDSRGGFVRYSRIYGSGDSRLARVAFTADRDLARRWEHAQDVRSMWQTFRKEIPPHHRLARTLSGRVYDHDSPQEISEFVRDLIKLWKRPDATIPGISRVAADVWAMEGTTLPAGTTFIGTVWLGANRTVAGEPGVLGPAAVWDDPAHRPQLAAIPSPDLDLKDILAHPPIAPSRLSFYHVTKRLFDIVMALVGLAMTLPLYPFILAAIWIEDGRPFFFAHQRETRGGREFGCLKFRSMRRDADAIKKQLLANNQSDGPQFFIESDPRMTRVGNFLRKTNLDEIPQLWNVLAGDMSFVGPRPSPRSENQYCPPWREARLSVTPGISGLWQVKRTRRRGMDFQEWIRFDMEYVEKAGWLLDLKIIVETVRVLVWGSKH